MTVLIRGDGIVEVGPAAAVKPVSGAVTIDGRGKYLMPGLVDLPVHLFNSRDLLLYLANGITTIRNLGGYGAADSILDIRREIATGGRLGPTIYTSGNWLDGDPPIRSVNTVVRTPEEARDIVSRQKKAGYDFIKVYQTLSPEVYAEIVRTARRVGIPVTGHVPASVGVEGVLASGQVGVDQVGSSSGGLRRRLALRAATVVPAEFLNRWVRGADQPGAVRKGGRADLLLLDANPLEDVAAHRRRVAVMARGKWLPQGKLDQMLERLAAGYAKEDSAAASR